jgi:hypothetical protein
MIGKFIIAGLCSLAFVAWGVTRIVANIQYDTQLGEYISQAATSPSPTVAEAKLAVAITEIERRGWTSGNTGIFFTYPTNDLAFWYQRLVDSRTILKALPPNDSALEISNTMMRVHESITGSNKEGTTILHPEGISVFPHNVAYFWWAWISFILAVIFWIWGCINAGQRGYF